MEKQIDIEYLLDLIYNDIQLVDDVSDAEMEDLRQLWCRYIKEASSLSLREPNDCCGVCTTRKITNEVYMRIVEMNDRVKLSHEYRHFEPRARELFLNSMKTWCLKLDEV